MRNERLKYARVACGGRNLRSPLANLDCAKLVVCIFAEQAAECDRGHKAGEEHKYDRCQALNIEAVEKIAFEIREAIFHILDESMKQAATLR